MNARGFVVDLRDNVLMDDQEKIKFRTAKMVETANNSFKK